MIGVSENRWTIDELGLQWLKKLFGPNTDCTTGKYRLLILDGHRSYITAGFDQYYIQNLIIVLCMPLYSFYLLQPLDVFCFSVLKRLYRLAIQEQMQIGIIYIDKDDFLDLYLQARAATYSSSIIQSGFRATGLVPFNPDEVLSQLYIQLKILSSTRSIVETPSLWVPETLYNIAELDLQTKAIQSLLRYCIASPHSPTVYAVNQLVKDCQIAMQNATLFAAENKRLQAANEKIKKKRQKKKSYIGKGGALSAGEV